MKDAREKARNAHATSPIAVARAGAVGNLLEWFDFALYGFMAPYLSTLFFPSDDPLSSLLAVFGAFAAGYLARPLGGVVFGHLGDTFGRAFIMIASVSVMGICTVGLGLLPTHEQVGALAGVLLVALRILQGLSVGGEFTGSAIFIAENTPVHRRGYYTSFIVSGAVMGFLLGSGLVTILANTFTHAEIEDFIWRIPFLAGAIIMGLGLVVRRRLGEVDIEHTHKEDLGMPPALYALRYHWRDMVLIGGLAIAANVGFYTTFVFAGSFLTETIHVSASRASDVNTICMIALLFIPLLAGLTSDRIGRKPVLWVATTGLILAAWPLWWLMNHQNMSLILLGQFGFAVLCGTLLGTVPTVMAESAPRNVRVSIACIGYNIPVAAFGGTAPTVATFLVERTGNDFSPAYYIMALSLISLTALAFLPESYRRRL